MMMLASWLDGKQGHVKLAPLVFDEIIATFLVRTSLPPSMLVAND